MRLARNLLLAATAAIAALAFMAISASAQSIEVHPEGVSTHCTDVEEGANHTVTGGCLIHIASEDNSFTVQHVGGVGEVQTSSCSSEYSARINEDGSGYISVNDASLNTGVGNCVVTPCDEAEPGEPSPHDELEWPISGLFEYGSGREALVRTFCLRASNQAEGAGSYCTVIVNVTQIAGHRQEFSANEAPCFETGGVTELVAHWITEEIPNAGLGEVDVQMEHIHYP